MIYGITSRPDPCPAESAPPGYSRPNDCSTFALSPEQRRVSRLTCAPVLIRAEDFGNPSHVFEHAGDPKKPRGTRLLIFLSLICLALCPAESFARIGRRGRNISFRLRVTMTLPRHKTGADGQLCPLR